ESRRNCGNVAASPVVSWMSDASAMFHGLFLMNDAKSSPPAASGCVSRAIGGVSIVSGPGLADVTVTGSAESAAGPVLTDTQSLETVTPDAVAGSIRSSRIWPVQLGSAPRSIV